MRVPGLFYYQEENMDETAIGYNLCEENWGKIREVEAIGEHLNDAQRWLEADNEMLTKEVDLIHRSAAETGKLLAYLIALQISLLEKL